MLDNDVRAWRGKSDFYTLFLAFADLVEDDVRLTRAITQRIRSALADFHDAVKVAKRKDNKKKFAKRVHMYAEAVSRAATDLSRRNTRA